MDAEGLAAAKVIRECAICGLVTDQTQVVCPEDGSALITRKPDPLIGQVLGGRFLILSHLGAGGMGNVYKAKQETIERMVAIKLLRVEKLNDNSSVKRFYQEARAAGRLSHRNIVSSFDFGLTEDNQPYIVMDYVEGTPLEVLLKKGPLRYERCVPLFMQACEALQHAHENGIIHRDIKPSNLMIVPQEDGSEVLKILDFGVAKLVPHADAPDAVSLTQTGELFGSPQYMSPEQWSGAELDSRSDMYSLGCVMYETLVGRSPAAGANLVETIHKHTHERALPFAQVRSDLELPEQLEAVVLKTLEKDKNARFPSMASLKHNLEFVPKFAEAEKVTPAPDSNPKPVAISLSSIRNHPALIPASLALVGCSLIACLMFGIAAALPPDHAPPWMTQIQLPIYEHIYGANSPKLVPLLEQETVRSLAEDKQDQALAYSQRIISILSASEPGSWNLASQEIRLGQQFLPKVPARAHQFLNDALTMLQRMADQNRKDQQWAANLDANQPVDETIISLQRQIHADQPNNTDIGESVLNHAWDLLRNKRTADAEKIFKELLAGNQTLSKEGSLSLADAIAELAAKDIDTGDESGSIANFKAALELKSKIAGAQSQPVAELQLQFGELLQKHQHYSEAEEMLLDALANAEAASGGESPQAVQILEQLGELYNSINAPEKAEGMYKMASEMQTSLRGKTKVAKGTVR